MRFIGTDRYVHGTPERSAVVLINLGTPPAPTAAAVRRYLREFLSDRRVIETNPLIWKPLLYGVILLWLGLIRAPLLDNILPVRMMLLPRSKSCASES